MVIPYVVPEFVGGVSSPPDDINLSEKADVIRTIKEFTN